MALPACRCGPTEPTPVTFRLKNTSREALFVEDTDGRHGMQVQRNVAGTWTSFVEEPPCACQACDRVCEASCVCEPEGQRTLRKVPAGQTVEREWAGRLHGEQLSSCGSLFNTRTCFLEEIPAVDERLRLQLCYSPSAPDFFAIDGGMVAPGVLPESGRLCVERDFQIIDGVVEVGPSRGADCSSHGDCTGTDELCFLGACTTACPANDFPQIGASWQVRVAEPDDQGFFTRVTEGGRTIWAGAGRVSSVIYQNNTMTLRLTRTGAGGEALTGAAYLTLPPAHAAPMSPGDEVAVRVIDASTSTNPENRALVVRDAAGALIIAADGAQLAPILGPDDTAPFVVSGNARPVGCQHDECGKRLYYTTTFEGGASAAELEPGKSVQVAAGEGTYRVLNATDYAYPSTWCRMKKLMPYAILRERVGR